MNILILETHSRQDVIQLVKKLKNIVKQEYGKSRITIQDLQQGYLDNIYDEYIDNFTLEIFGKTINSITRISDKYLAAELMVNTIHEMRFDANDNYKRLTKFSDDYLNKYCLIEDTYKGKDYLFLAIKDGNNNKKRIGEPIKTYKQLYEAAKKCEMTEYLIKYHFDLLGNWHLPIGPKNFYATVPMPKN